jgi:hypothetical protein
VHDDVRHVVLQNGVDDVVGHGPLVGEEVVASEHRREIHSLGSLKGVECLLGVGQVRSDGLDVTVPLPRVPADRPDLPALCRQAQRQSLTDRSRCPDDRDGSHVRPSCPRVSTFEPHRLSSIFELSVGR